MTGTVVLTAMTAAAFIVWLLNQIERRHAVAGSMVAFWILLLSYWAFT